MIWLLHPVGVLHGSGCSKPCSKCFPWPNVNIVYISIKSSSDKFISITKGVKKCTIVLHNTGECGTQLLTITLAGLGVWGGRCDIIRRMNVACGKSDGFVFPLRMTMEMCPFLFFHFFFVLKFASWAYLVRNEYRAINNSHNNDHQFGS